MSQFNGHCLVPLLCEKFENADESNHPVLDILRDIQLFDYDNHDMTLLRGKFCKSVMIAGLKSYFIFYIEW